MDLQGQHTLAAAIDQAHQARPQDWRDHLGASVLGHPCERWLWLSFRWAIKEEFSGRILRVFRRGQNEEAIVVSDLRAAGLDVRHTGDNQKRVDLGPHLGGSLDGIVESGVPEAPKARHVLEIKTHSLKSFNDLVRDGVERSKPQHFVQMQCYMHATKIERALYIAVCKDNDRLHIERVRYDKAVAEKAIARGRRIVSAERIPMRIHQDPSWWQCSYCAAHAMCHKAEPTRETNCRTCAHSTAMDDGTWRCERHDADAIPPEFQRQGCESHALHPDLVPWEMADPVDKWTPVFVINGKKVANGEGDAHVFTSREILANPAQCAENDMTLQQLRGPEWGGRVVG